MIGKLLDQRYQVVQVLGQGGFGHTYTAEDTRRPGNPTCVVKQLKPATSDPEFLQTARRLFNSEAETLEKLGNHDQIPRLLAYFEENEEFYLVQEFIDGHPLSVELPPGERWNENQVIQFLQEVLPILEFVHNNGVIHRDIKPDNLIRRNSDNKLVLVDFGAVKQIKLQSVLSQEQLNNETVAIGTPGYMPSEQGQGRPRPSSDIYALGMIAIQALTGLRPTQLAEDPETGEILWRQHAQVSDLLAEVLSRMVRHYFKFRYQSAIEALQAIEPLTHPYTPKALAVAVNQMGRSYLRDGYQLAVKALRSLQPKTKIYSTPNQLTPAGYPPQPPTTPIAPAVPATDNTVTIAPGHPTPSTNPAANPASVHTSQKLPWLMGVGGVVVVVAIAGIFAVRQPQSALKTTTNQLTTTAETNNAEQQKSCIVVTIASNVRSQDGRRRTGEVIPAGTKVVTTGREEDGWLEISSPVSGWIWKNRTRNICPSN